MADVCQVREFLLEKAIFQLEDEHGAASDVVVAKVPPTASPILCGMARPLNFAVVNRAMC